MWRTTAEDIPVLAGDTIAIQREGRIHGLDARTGATRWVSPLDEPGVLLAADGFLLSSGPSTDENVRRFRITSIDARTGVDLWTIESGFPGDGPWRPHFSLIGVTTRHAVIILPALRTVRAFDLSDGGVSWETSLPGGCEAVTEPNRDVEEEDDRGSANRDVVIVLLRCAERLRLLGLAPNDGRIRWNAPVADRTVPALSFHSGVISLRSRHFITLVSSGGTVLYDRTSSRTCEAECRVEILGDAAFVSRRGGLEEETVVEMVDQRTGRTGWTRVFKNSHPDGLRVVGGRLYMERELPQPLVHRVLDLLDPVTGRSVLTTSDFQLEGMGKYVVAWYGDLFYAVPSEPDEKIVLTALRFTPIQKDRGWGARGGVPVTAWPDACSLLLDGPGTRIGRSAPAELNLPGTVACELRPASGSGATVKVSLVWVHPSPAQAKIAVDDKALLERPGWITSVADQAYFLNNAFSDAVLFRSGSVVVTVEALGDPAMTKQATLAAAETLRAGSREGRP
ncbi:hypothetical protein Pve01_08390 [Planomonospora venezuelensis]|nr:hypothetical protein Pve01_08390 [Planomonospora venezuelensis]